MRRFSLAAMGYNTVTSAPFLIDENCEGTGTPSGWVDLSGSPNWDYTASPLVGSQSLYCPMVGAACKTRTNDFTGGAIPEVWVYFRMKATNGTNPSTATTFMGIGASGTPGSTATWRILSTLRMCTATGAGTVSTISLDTDYHFWIHYLKGTGANAVVDIAFSTSGVRPTSGNNFFEVTTDVNTFDAARISLGGGSTTMGMDIVFDTIRVRGSQIGDNGV